MPVTLSIVGSIILRNFMPLVGTLCYVRGTPFFLFFFFCFTPVLLLKNISAIMKNFSAIKRVVKHEKMAIYGGYSLYSWTIGGNTLLCASTLFFSFFFCYPLYSWKYNFEELCAPYPLYSVNTLLCARYPFFSFFFPHVLLRTYCILNRNMFWSV